MAAGGRWARGGLRGAMLCFTDLPDAGKPCNRGTDCQGDCVVTDGRGQCQKTTPMFGCYSVLDGEGRQSSICRD